MNNTTEILENIGRGLAVIGQARYSEDSLYQETPATPAVVFGDVDVPDTIVRIEVAEHEIVNPGSLAPYERFEVRLVWRATGKDWRPVQRFVDALLQWLADWRESGPKDAYNIPHPPPSPLGCDLILVGRKRPEVLEKQPSKYSGARWQAEATFLVGSVL